MNKRTNKPAQLQYLLAILSSAMGGFLSRRHGWLTLPARLCVCDMLRVPAWRRRLLCTICGVGGGCGACVRCEMPSCTNAFHAMCAHTAGVYMRIEPAFVAANGSRSVPARRTVYCDLHRPVQTSAVRTTGADFTHKLNGCLKNGKIVTKQLDVQSSALNATSLHIPSHK